MSIVRDAANLNVILNSCREEYENGLHTGALDAALVCISRGAPVPDWAQETVEQALREARHAKRGKRGNWESQLNRHLRASAAVRHVDLLEDLGMTRPQAFEALGKSSRYHSAKAVERLYYRAKTD